MFFLYLPPKKVPTMDNENSPAEAAAMQEQSDHENAARRGVYYAPPAEKPVRVGSSGVFPTPYQPIERSTNMTTGQHGSGDNLDPHKQRREEELRSLGEYQREQDKKEAQARETRDEFQARKQRELDIDVLHKRQLRERLNAMSDGGDIAKRSLPGMSDELGLLREQIEQAEEHKREQDKKEAQAREQCELNAKALVDNDILRERGMSPVEATPCDTDKARQSFTPLGKPTVAYNISCTVGECPRLPYPDENLVGTVCICSSGRIGIVSNYQSLHWGPSWVGMGIDGKGVWASTRPVVIAESVDEFRAKCMERFDGKLSRLG